MDSVFSLDKAIYAVLISFVLNILLCPVLIPYLHKLKFGQYIREDGPKTHLKKGGTPTMGGITILISFVLTAIFFIKGNMDGVAITLMTLAYGIIGFMDDYIKVVKKRSLGLRAYQKIIMQLLVSAGFLFYLIYIKNIGTDIYIPFAGGFTFNLGLLYIPFSLVVILGTSNAVNLTDGLDGLASGVTALVATFFLIVAWASGSTVYPVIGAAVGSLLGFLLFNSYPARVFMGDTGSLALGGFIASVSLITKMPIFILLVGIIYFMEALSVILQVVYFKMTGGKRIFKMAPIHHHFELCGWAETKVVALFYVITAIACLVGFLGTANYY